MRIDIHSHVIPARVVDELARSPNELAARVTSERGSRSVIHEQGWTELLTLLERSVG